MENKQEEKKYTLIINIAAKGTLLNESKKEGDTSSVGHMWYQISGGDKDGSYGFAPIEHGSPLGAGKIYDNDSSNYATRYYTAEVVITKEQYDTLARFGDIKNLNGNEFDFSTYYNGSSNSCVDYTWRALHEAGINNRKTLFGGVYEGQTWPTHNADDVDKVLYQYANGNTQGWNEDLSDAGGYHVKYGNDKANELTSTKDTYAVYSGAGDDTLKGIAGHTDRLRGGKDFDTYKVQEGDMIKDRDNKGQIYFNAKLLSGIKYKVSENTYEDAMFSYTKEENNLIIAQKEDPSKSITVEDWNENKEALGITLSEEKAQTQEDEKGAYVMEPDILLSSGPNTTTEKDIKLSPEGYAIYEEAEEIDDTNTNEDDYGMEM